MARKTRITRITTLPHVPGGPAENWQPAQGLIATGSRPSGVRRLYIAVPTRTACIGSAPPGYGAPR